MRKERPYSKKNSAEIISCFQGDVKAGDVPLRLYGVKTNYKGKPYLKYDNIKLYDHVNYSYYESTGRGSSVRFGRGRMYSSRRVGMKRAVNHFELMKGFNSLLFDESGGYLYWEGKKYLLTGYDNVTSIPYEDREIQVLIIRFVKDGRRVQGYVELDKPDFQRVLINEFVSKLVYWNIDIRDVEKHLVNLANKPVSSEK